MRDSRQVLEEMVLFYLEGHCNFQNDATTSVAPDSKSLLCQLSNDVSFTELYWKVGEYQQNHFPA